MREKSFDPIDQLDALAKASKRTFAFDAKTRAAAVAWQKRARVALGKTLGFLDQRRVPLGAKRVEVVDRGEYVREKIVIRTSGSSAMPMYVLIPKQGIASNQNTKNPHPNLSTPRSPRQLAYREKGPECATRRGEKLPCMLALHGHGYGVGDIVGIRADGSERDSAEGYHADFGVELVKRGFIVVAPEISCFGERGHDYSHLGERRRPTVCHNANTYAMMLGGSVAGMRVWDGMRAVDYLETLKMADVSRLGVMGISGGGMHAFFSACLDQRIKAAVISGYFCDWRNSILAINHCTCNFVPGLLRLGELSDLAGLIAPRPVLVENGMRDDIFPIGAVKKTVKKARRAWKVFGVEKNLQTDYFEGGHQIHGVEAYLFLERVLKGQ